ncbi:MAG: sensor histidine kinase [Wenzhouxiangella sp.]|nr:sensor histidine kinase [Wenzhouxiangella sp.]
MSQRAADSKIFPKIHQWVDGLADVLARLQPVDWLRYLGLLTWALAAIVLAIFPRLLSEPPETAAVIGWWSAAVLFLLAFIHPAMRQRQRSPLWLRVVLLLILSGSALAINYFTQSTVGIILVMVVASVLPWLLPALLGVAWVGALALVVGLWVILSPEGSLLLALVFMITSLGLVLFPFIASLLALQQLQARADLRRVNAQLLATQSLLAENTRIAERVRISRDLHDLMGHHLTALTLNLEAASHSSADDARSHVARAESVARELLGDVREVVSDLRRDDQVDLRRALETLTQGVPELDIHLDIPASLSQTDPQRAQALLRCAQEIITNAVRHADANALWIALTDGEDGLALMARDDGAGTEEFLPGNGINGMRERLKELGGRLDVSTGPGLGFRVRAWLPEHDQQ